MLFLTSLPPPHIFLLTPAKRKEKEREKEKFRLLSGLRQGGGDTRSRPINTLKKRGGEKREGGREVFTKYPPPCAKFIDQVREEKGREEKTFLLRCLAILTSVT